MVKLIRQAMKVTITREAKMETYGTISFLMNKTKTMETLTMVDKTQIRTVAATLEVTITTTRTSMALTTATLATMAAEKSRLPRSQR